jgi:protein SCO1
VWHLVRLVNKFHVAKLRRSISEGRDVSAFVHRNILTTASAALVVIIAAAGCGGKTAGAADYHGVTRTPALAKPAFTLIATDGKPYAFVERTAGHVAFLFFGYTHCPDACPAHMQNIAAVLKGLPAADRQRVDVVFVTTDPDRDTPAALRAWLSNFDSSFVGLTGAPDDVARIQASMGMPPSMREMTSDGSLGGYGMGHAAQVLAFGSDDSAHVEYPFGIQREDWAHDLPLLLHTRWRPR